MAKIIGGSKKTKTINRRQFNYLLSAGIGMVRYRTEDGKLEYVDFVKTLGLKIKFPIKIKADGKVH